MWRPGYNNFQLPLTRQDKLLYLVTSGAAGLLLLIGRLLQPAPGRVGTHEQLGLPPCGFLHLTGIPCPGCGLTTSVAYAVRLHFIESVVTQPFGFVVFLFASLSIPVSVYLVYRRIPYSCLANFRGKRLVTYLLITFFLFSWLYKIAVMKGFFANG
jgi:hypothetical protein